MNNTYLITLTPTGKFFFGGEMTFKVKGESDDFNSQYSSYIISSNKMPQQTSLLGMLRFLILRNAGETVFADNKIQSRQRAALLIGQSSFMVTVDHQTSSFGAIGRITPCFLLENGRPVPVFSKVSPDKFDMSDGVPAFFNSKEVNVPDSSYKSKEIKKHPLEDYFIQDQRMGLNKAYDGKKKELKDDETDLFKQVNLRLNEEKNLKFAFYATVDAEVPMLEYDGQLVTLGADGSTFVIGITKADYQEAKTESEPRNLCVILSSPSYIEADKLDCVDFATTSIIPFRFLSTTVDTVSYDRLSHSISHGEKYNLYDTGSVFYFTTKEKQQRFVEALESYHDFRQIGYNYYITND